MKSVKERSRSNVPETDQNAHAERLSLPATNAEPLLQSGCQQGSPADIAVHRARSSCAAIAGRSHIADSADAASVDPSGCHQRGNAKRFPLSAPAAERLHHTGCQGSRADIAVHDAQRCASPAVAGILLIAVLRKIADSAPPAPSRLAAKAGWPEALGLSNSCSQGRCAT
jgi:hypothetical protein